MEDAENNAEITLEEAESTQALDELVSVEREELPALIECLLVVNGHPLTEKRLSSLTGFPKEEIQAALQELKQRLLDSASGFEVAEVCDGFQLRTLAKFGPHIRALKMDRPRRLSAPALETLAIIAYRQPIVKSDIETIRGVDATPTLKTLIDRKLIRIIGHQNTPGTPALYGTTDNFLELFGLKSLTELPTLRDLRELNNEPGESEEEQDLVPELAAELAEESSDSEQAQTIS